MKYLKIRNMMNHLTLGAITLLIVAPAISICDEDLSKINSFGTSEPSRDQTSSYESATKHPPYESNEGRDFTNENAINDPWSFYRQLRSPSGFFGVRGKKDFQSSSNWDQDLYSLQPKRAPSQAFFGMRGKKYYGEKRAPSGFYGMRGKKNEYERTEDDLQAELFHDLEEERSKIADLLEDYMDEKEKRKPSGFVGLRGKKSVNNDDYFDFEKRAPMGFQGVRGKKSEFSNFIGTDDKRMPVAGFFGMRGKKQPFGFVSSNYFGVRKKPYMPYGKFVGVRGKKDGSMKRLRLDDADLSETNGLRSASRVASEGTQDKKIGFIGMRG